MVKKYDLNFNKVVGFLFTALLVSFMVSNALMQLISTLLVVAAVIHIFKNKDKINYFSKIPPYITWSILGFVGLGFLTSFLYIEDTELLLDALKEYKWIFSYFLFGYLLYNFFNNSWIKKSHYTLAIAIIISIYAIWQAFYGMDLITGDHSRVIGKEPLYRSIGTFGLPLTFAYLYGSLFFIFLPQIRGFKNKYATKKLLILATSLLLISVILSQTRGAWLALLATTFICGLFFFKKLRLILLVLVLTSPAIYNFAPSNFKGRVKSIVDVKQGGVNKGRLNVWAAHYSRFKDSPWLGSGISNYHSYIKEYYAKNNVNSEFIAHAHNSYLHILSAQGILGFMPFMIFHIGFLFLAYKCYLSSDIVSSTLGISSFGTQLYLYFGGLTEAVFLDSELNQMLSLVWALTTVLYIKGKDKLRAQTL